MHEAQDDTIQYFLETSLNLLRKCSSLRAGKQTEPVKTDALNEYTDHLYDTLPKEIISRERISERDAKKLIDHMNSMLMSSNDEYRSLRINFITECLHHYGEILPVNRGQTQKNIIERRAISEEKSRNLPQGENCHFKDVRVAQHGKTRKSEVYGYPEMFGKYGISAQIHAGIDMDLIDDFEKRPELRGKPRILNYTDLDEAPEATSRGKSVHAVSSSVHFEVANSPYEVNLYIYVIGTISDKQYYISRYLPDDKGSASLMKNRYEICSAHVYPEDIVGVFKKTDKKIEKFEFFDKYTKSGKSTILDARMRAEMLSFLDAQVLDKDAARRIFGDKLLRSIQALNPENVKDGQVATESCTSTMRDFIHQCVNEELVRKVKAYSRASEDSGIMSRIANFCAKKSQFIRRVLLRYRGGHVVNHILNAVQEQSTLSKSQIKDIIGNATMDRILEFTAGLDLQVKRDFVNEHSEVRAQVSKTPQARIYMSQEKHAEVQGAINFAEPEFEKWVSDLPYCSTTANPDSIRVDGSDNFPREVQQEEGFAAVNFAANRMERLTEAREKAPQTNIKNTQRHQQGDKHQNREK